jgi:hypothetical protein
MPMPFIFHTKLLRPISERRRDACTGSPDHYIDSPIKKPDLVQIAYAAHDLYPVAVELLRFFMLKALQTYACLCHMVRNTLIAHAVIDYPLQRYVRNGN